MSTRKRGKAIGVGVLALVAAVVATSLGVAGAGAGEQSAFALPRAQTLYMSGNQWSPNNDLNPAKNWDYVTGLVGLGVRDAVPLRPADRTSSSRGSPRAARGRTKTTTS